MKLKQSVACSNQKTEHTFGETLEMGTDCLTNEKSL